MIYFSSDQHFFHKNAATNPDFGRNFSSVEEMNETLIDNWNSVVNKEDTVYVVGDFSFGNTTQTTQVFNRLKGNKILVKGNHDDRATLKMPWGAIDKQLRVKWKDKVFWLTHYPTKSWDLSYHGSYHLFGHVHSKGDYWAEGLSCDVGVDFWDFKPVSADTLIELFESLERLKNENGHFMWRGKPETGIEVVYYKDLEKIKYRI